MIKIARSYLNSVVHNVKPVPLNTRRIAKRANLEHASLYKPSKTLVVILPWTRYSRAELDDYMNLYRRREMDILVLRTAPWYVMSPPRGSKKLFNPTAEFLAHCDYENLIIHGLSVGGYTWGEILMALSTTQDGLKAIGKVRGVILDSVLELQHIHLGFIEGQTKSDTFATTLEIGSLGHGDRYAAAYEALEAKTRCPSLFFVSQNDKLSSLDFSRSLANTWSHKLTNSVTFNVWNDGHVGHLNGRPRDYESAVDQFVDSLEID